MKIYAPNIETNETRGFVYVPLSGDIESYVNNANSGDTLMLSAGTYTITDDIDVTKSINIVGQGPGKTIVYCSTASKNMFDISSSDVKLYNMTIISEGIDNKVINISVVGCDNLVFEDLDITVNSSGSLYGMYFLSSDAIVRRCTVSVISSTSYAYGLFCTTTASSAADSTVNVEDSYFSSDAGGGQNSYAYYALSNLTARTQNLNIYRSTGTAGDGGASDSAVNSASVISDLVVIKAYQCVFYGADYDARNTSYNYLTLYDCVLVNGTTDGTVRYGGINVANYIYTDGNIYESTSYGVIASSVQSQGYGLLTSDINEVSTCSTSNDVVTLPSASAGMAVTVINNGANTLQIFPYSGDDLGGGVDASTTLATTKSKRFTAYNTTTWVAEALN